MTIPVLAHLSPDELLATIRTLREKERHAIADVVLFLSEVDTRGIYRDYGYPSLFLYCTQALKYSEAGACRRIAAARCLRENPEIYEKLKSGSMTLCTICEVSKVLTGENKGTLLTASEGCSKREVERITAQYKAPESIKRDRIIAKRVTAPAPTLFAHSEGNGLPSPVTVEEHFAFQFEGDAEFMKLYEETKALMGGAPTMAEVFARALRLYRQVKSPIERARRRGERRVKGGKPASIRRTRHIPAPVRDYVFIRDGGRCVFVSPDGHRCTQTHALQLDHVQPYSLGGAHTTQNLRLLCPAHNRLLAERAFGSKVRAQFRR